MLPKHARSSLGRGARGAYNSYFVTLARNLVNEGEGHAFLRQDAAKRREMQRFAVGDHAIEVEDHGADHFLSRSPARIGIWRRFSAGGYGHS